MFILDPIDRQRSYYCLEELPLMLIYPLEWGGFDYVNALPFFRIRIERFQYRQD